ncbi:hypothetical protein [Nocardia sp. CNY236]|uniref:hypothetical protein n=1 Tax=Nocardia sp. CNY236 TaxID=1169152 RepID=UPI0012DC3CA3|nr:hypothetical protein [Nocardia sp. CNY236]
MVDQDAAVAALVADGGGEQVHGCRGADFEQATGHVVSEQVIAMVAGQGLGGVRLGVGVGAPAE